MVEPMADGFPPYTEGALELYADPGSIGIYMAGGGPQVATVLTETCLDGEEQAWADAQLFSTAGDLLAVCRHVEQFLRPGLPAVTVQNMRKQLQSVIQSTRDPAMRRMSKPEPLPR